MMFSMNFRGKHEITNEDRVPAPFFHFSFIKSFICENRLCTFRHTHISQSKESFITAIDVLEDMLKKILIYMSLPRYSMRVSSFG